MAVPEANLSADHNSSAELEDLRKTAERRQIEAQQAWSKLLEAQIAHEQSWERIINSARFAGAPTALIQKVFDVSPSTFSRWSSGHASPSAALRQRLSADLLELVRGLRDRVQSTFAR